MRKITQEACEAFHGGYAYRNGNTHVEIDRENSEVAMFLHGNKIAQLINGKLYVSLCGWNTNTTRERLNGINGVSVTTKNGQAYLNGHKWNGDYVTPATFTGNVSDGDTKKRNALKKRIAEYSKLYTHPYPQPSGGDCWHCALVTDSKQSLGDATKNHEHLLYHMGIPAEMNGERNDVYVHGSLIVNALREHGCNDMQIGVWFHHRPMQEQVQKAIRKYLQKRLVP